MVQVEIRVSGVKRLNAKFKRFENTVRGNLSRETVDKGYDFAQRIMPRDTGAMSRALQKINGKQSSRLRLNQPAGQRGRPYHMWMHGIKTPGPGGKGYDTSRGWVHNKTGKITHINTGSPNFMFKTREFMSRTTNDTISKQIRKAFQ